MELLPAHAVLALLLAATLSLAGPLVLQFSPLLFPAIISRFREFMSLFVCSLTGVLIDQQQKKTVHLFAVAYDPLDPHGNITIKWDIISWTPDGYVVSTCTFFT